MSAELAGLRLHREASAVERVQGQTAAAAAAGHLAARRENFFVVLNIFLHFFLFNSFCFLNRAKSHSCCRICLNLL
jgi:hypothetical protein